MSATRRSSRRLAAAAAAMLLAASLGVAIGGCRTQSELDAGPAPAPLFTGGGEPVRIIYPSAPQAFVELAADAKKTDAVVAIRSTVKVSNGPASLYPASSDDFALGTGFFIDEAGHVLTSELLIANARELRVVLADGTELPAKVIGRDTRLDVALLAVDGATKVKPLPFGVSGALKVGEWVLALGNPFGGEVTASAGVLSTLGRNIGGDLTRRNDVADYAAFLQSSAAVTALNAGGPLVTMAGEIVGINVAHDARGGPIGFAVPIDRVKDIIPMLEASGVVSRTWLGIYVQPVTPEQAKERGMPDAGGALITDVIVPGPGSKAGLRRGDIIRRFAATAVDSRNLPWIASTTAVGKAIDLEVWRDRGVVQLTLVTEAMPK